MIWGEINEHLFFDMSNSISRLVSGGLLPNNPALALLWLLIPISGLSHGVIATVVHVFINFTFHHLFIGQRGWHRHAGTSDKGLREDAIPSPPLQRPTDSEGVTCSLFFCFFFLSFFTFR